MLKVHDRGNISNVTGYIVPWALPRENIPIHIELPKDIVFDEICIKIPNDFKFVDFLNVEEVKIAQRVASAPSTNLIPPFNLD